MTRLGRQVSACVAEALDRLEEMREAEGRSLASEMHSLVADIGARTAELESLTDRSRPAYALRLRTKVEELLANLPEARGDLPGNIFRKASSIRPGWRRKRHFSPSVPT